MVTVPNPPTAAAASTIPNVRTFAGVPESVSQARAWAASFLPGSPAAGDVALLTSELVTNAITHQAGGSIMVAVSCCLGELRVDVYDTARAWPALVSAPAEAEAGRGLLLVAALSTSWGVSRTPTGKAVYFTLAPRPDLAGGAGRGP